MTEIPALSSGKKRRGPGDKRDRQAKQVQVPPQSPPSSHPLPPPPQQAPRPVMPVMPANVPHFIPRSILHKPRRFPSTSSSHTDFYSPSFSPRRQPYSAPFHPQAHETRAPQPHPLRESVQNTERASLYSASPSVSLDSQSSYSSTSLEDTLPQPIMGNKRRGKGAGRPAKTISEHISENEWESMHDQSRSASVPGAVKEGHRPPEKVPNLKASLPSSKETHSEPSSIRPSPPSSTRLWSEDNAPAPSRPQSKDKNKKKDNDNWSAEGDDASAPEETAKGAKGNDLPAVPTWPTVGIEVISGVGRRLVPRPANGVAVPNPRPWGTAVATLEEQEQPSDAEPTPTNATPTDLDDGGWDVNDRLHKWVSHVKRVPPVPPIDSAATAPATETPSEVSSISRPNSAREKPPPVTLYYSDSDPVSPKSNKETIEDKQAGDDKPETSGDDKTEASVDELPRAESTAVYPTQPPPSKPGSRSFSRHSMVSSLHAVSMGRPRRPTDDNQSQRDKWWKKDNHPMFCPSFAKQRIIVTTQFPIRSAELRTAMYDHFSCYGAVRCVVPCNVFDKDNTDKVTVVFKDASSVAKVLADPKHTECVFRSTYSRSGASVFDIDVEHYPIPTLTYVWVKVTGRRFDSRSRSASPTPAREDGGWGGEDPHDHRTLPGSVQVYAVAKYLKRHETWVYRAVILDRPYQVFRDQCIRETQGREPIFLAELQMCYRFAEKDFLPQLVDYFVDVHDVKPPGEASSGWLFGVGSDQEARHLMTHLAAVPGLTHRFARKSDEFPVNAVFSPLKESEPSLEGGEDDGSDSPVSDTSSIARRNARFKASMAAVERPASLPAKPVETGLQQDEFPHLERQVVLTYRGRVLREEVVDGQPRYIDDAAIFVGRLVKERETSISLLKRFEQYGPIVSVEYNPLTSNGTYGTARVLFQLASSAKAAIEWENGAVSFGSALKVEPRKVLPMDVQARVMYVDPNGRAVSPSMAHQYTPPPPIESDGARAESSSPTKQPPSASTPPFFPASWYSVMGPHHQWIPQMFGPPPTGDMVSSGIPPDQGSRAPPMPMMWHFGVGFYHPSFHQVPPTEPAKPAVDPTAFPPSSPVDAGLQSSMVGLSIGQPTSPASPNAGPKEPTSTTPAPRSADPAEKTTTGAKDIEPKAGEGVTSPDSKPTLKARGSTFEDGVFKVIYDPEELKQYREEHQLKEPPSAAPATAPPTAAPPSPFESPMLPLLPLHTGGHEAHRRTPSQASSYLDVNSGQRAHRLFSNDFDAGGRRSSYVTPMGNQFPEPIGSHIDTNLARQVIQPGFAPRDQYPRIGFGEPGRIGGGGGRGAGGRGGRGGGGGGGRRNGRNDRGYPASRPHTAECDWVNFSTPASFADPLYPGQSQDTFDSLTLKSRANDDVGGW